MSKQKKPVCRKEIEEGGKKEYVTWVPDYLVPNSIPIKVRLYFPDIYVHDTDCQIFLISHTPFVFNLI